MRSLPLFTGILFCLLGAAPLRAQDGQRSTLTDAQSQQIAEAGVDPDARIGLYTKFLNDRADTIKSLIKRHESARDRHLDGELEDFASLADELASNLDEYGGRKADIRKSLKSLNESIPRWQGIFHDLPSDPVFQVSRDAANGAVSDLAGEVKQLVADQEAYFKAHKDAKGEQRAEPQQAGPQ